MSYTEDYYTETLNGEYVEGLLEEDDDDPDYDTESLLDDDDDDPEYGEQLFGEDDDIDYGESVRIRGINQRYRPGFRRPSVSTRYKNYGQRIGKSFKGRGIIRTPAGSARIRLPRNIATKSEMKSALAAVGRDIQRNARGIVKINSNLNRLDRRYNTISKSLASSAKKADKVLAALQQQQLFSALLPPKLEEIVVNDANDDKSSDITYTVKSSKTDTTTTLLLAMMSGSGGLSSGGGMNNMMMPLMVLAMDNDKDDDNTMLLMLAMMMGQQK